MVISERDNRHESVISAGCQMMRAARTSPKAKGADLIEAVLVDGEDLQRLAGAMLELYGETGRPVYKRDSANILQGEAVMLVGVRHQLMGLNCGHCGFRSCADKPQSAPCSMNSYDVGIAVGSACAAAADLMVDTRVMFSAGMGAMRLGLLPGCRSVIAIAISASSKNPFFDR